MTNSPIITVPANLPDMYYDKFKNRLGDDGQGFEAILYINGVKAAKVINRCDGSPFEWQNENVELMAIFDAYAASLPAVQVPELETTVEVSRDILAEELAIFTRVRISLDKVEAKMMVVYYDSTKMPVDAYNSSQPIPADKQDAFRQALRAKYTSMVLYGDNKANFIRRIMTANGNTAIV